MKKSSRGNPWHDAKGRFCHGPEAKIDTWGNPISDEQRKEAVKKVDWKTERDYMVQTARRKREANPPPKVDAYVVSDGEVKTVFGDKIQKGMIVEYDPAWAEPGREEEESRYLFIVRDMNVNEKGKGWADIICLNGMSSFATINRVDAESIRPTSKEKVDTADDLMTSDERAKMKRLSGWKAEKK